MSGPLGRLGAFRPPPGEEKDIELGSVQSSAALSSSNNASEDMRMDAFFTEIKDIKALISGIQKLTEDIEKNAQSSFECISAEKRSELSKKNEALIESCSTKSLTIRKALKQLGQENKTLKAKYGNDANMRIRDNQYRQLINSFTDTMKNFQTTQDKYKDKYYKIIQRQYLIVNPDAKEDDFKRLIEGNDTLMSQQIFSLDGTQKAEATKALAEIRERHSDILIIEKSVLELHQLFTEMATLIEQQGDLVNQIERNVGEAEAHTKAAEREMRSAVIHQKSRMKKKGFLVFLVILIIFGGAAAVYFGLIAKKN